MHDDQYFLNDIYNLIKQCVRYSDKATFTVYVMKFQKIRELVSGFVFKTIVYIVYGYKHNSDYVRS